ncbi:hypothetical protein RHMOL_Rhmol10G0232300 [Rhododendron molle]|uniref:Uncharacterized protein n=1 Tax=Rhododendron molle TaxID=49168 RepID=A0ACC0M6I4_RHOML|nr:hypothetical protein RHMOL_Rhmol10G0232300 [Rhododendron molle]
MRRLASKVVTHDTEQSQIAFVTFLGFTWSRDCSPSFGVFTSPCESVKVTNAIWDCLVYHCTNNLRN